MSQADFPPREANYEQVQPPATSCKVPLNHSIALSGGAPCYHFHTARTRPVGDNFTTRLLPLSAT
jgi:hypothetical protein